MSGGWEDSREGEWEGGKGEKKTERKKYVIKIER